MHVTLVQLPRPLTFAHVTTHACTLAQVVPENADDIWHLYNLINIDDEVECTTTRKVKHESTAEGSRDSSAKTVKLTLKVRVEDVEYDAEGASIRLKGINKTVCEAVKLNAYHTVEIIVGRGVKIEKLEWDSVDVRRLEEAADPSTTADVGVVLIEEGLANVVLVGATRTMVKAKIESSIPRKRGMALMGFEKAINKFFANVAVAVERHIDFEKVKCLVIAGPGFTKDTFHDFLKLDAVQRNLKTLQSNFGRVIKAHASAAYVHALNEVLENPTVRGVIADTKAASEVKALDDFFEMLANDPARAFYGPAHVMAAHELNAIDQLLLTDAVFRTRNVAHRKMWVRATEEVVASGGRVHLFSSAHASGGQLEQLTGAAAILRFPLPDLADAELKPL